MEIPFFALAMLVCPIGMGLMMWFMAKGMGMGQKPDPGPDPASLAEPRAEREHRIAETRGQG